MTPNLIELIVQAVKEAGTIYTDATEPSHEIECVSIPLDSLRTALASIPEMPQVDLGEYNQLLKDAMKELSFHAMQRMSTPRYLEYTRHSDVIQRMVKAIELTSPTTKTE